MHGVFCRNPRTETTTVVDTSAGTRRRRPALSTGAGERSAPPGPSINWDSDIATLSVVDRPGRLFLFPLAATSATASASAAVGRLSLVRRAVERVRAVGRRRFLTRLLTLRHLRVPVAELAAVTVTRVRLAVVEHRVLT